MNRNRQAQTEMDRNRHKGITPFGGLKWGLLFKVLSLKKKSRLRETKHLSNNADSSTDTTVGWTKNTQNPIFWKNRKFIQNAKKQNV